VYEERKVGWLGWDEGGTEAAMDGAVVEMRRRVMTCEKEVCLW